MECMTKYELSPFTALLNIIKVSYFEKTEVFKTLLAVLDDFDPDIVSSKQKTEQYIKLLLQDNRDLADCLITFLPGSQNECVSTEPTDRICIKTKKKKKKKHKKPRNEHVLPDSTGDAKTKEPINQINKSENTDPASAHNTISTAKPIETTFIDPTSFSAVRKEIYKTCPASCSSPHTTRSYNITPHTFCGGVPICKVTPSENMKELSIPIEQPSMESESIVRKERIVSQGHTILPVASDAHRPSTVNIQYSNINTVTNKVASIQNPMMLSCSENSGNILKPVPQAQKCPVLLYNNQPQNWGTHSHVPIYHGNTIAEEVHPFTPRMSTSEFRGSKSYPERESFPQLSPDILSVINSDNATISNSNNMLNQDQGPSNLLQRPPYSQEINPIWPTTYDSLQSMKRHYPFQEFGQPYQGPRISLSNSNIFHGNHGIFQSVSQANATARQPLHVTSSFMPPQVTPFFSTLSNRPPPQGTPLFTTPPTRPQVLSSSKAQMAPLFATLPVRPQVTPSASQPHMNQVYHIPPTHIFLNNASNLSSFPYTHQIIFPENNSFATLKKYNNQDPGKPLSSKIMTDDMAPSFHKLSDNDLKEPSSKRGSENTNDQRLPMTKKRDRNNDQRLPFHNEAADLRTPMEESFQNIQEIHTRRKDEEDSSETVIPKIPKKLTMTPNQGVRKKLRLIPFKSDAKENQEFDLHTS